MSVVPDLPGRKVQGSAVSATDVNRATENGRRTTLRGSPSAAVRRGPGGTSIRVKVPPAPPQARRSRAASYLQLTLTPPPGWERPEGETRTPIFLSFGTVGEIIPTGIDTQLIWVTLAGTGVRYFWLKITLDEAAPMFATAVEIVNGATSTAFSTAAFNSTTGELPAEMYIMLGAANVVDGALTLSNTGNGSVMVECYASNMQCTDSGAMAVHRFLTYKRLPNA